MGAGNKDLESLKHLAECSKGKVSLHWNTPVISSIMAQSDIAVTSAGRTVYELGSLGIPMMVICQNERETKHHFARDNPGVVNLGLGQLLSRKEFNLAFVKFPSSPLLRKKMQNALLLNDFRGGIRRVWKIITGEGM